MILLLFVSPSNRQAEESRQQARQTYEAAHCEASNVSKDMTKHECVKQLLQTAQFLGRVFPLWGVRETVNGQLACECGRKACKTPESTRGAGTGSRKQRLMRS